MKQGNNGIYKILVVGVILLAFLLLYVKYVEEINRAVIDAKYAIYEVVSENPRDLLLERQPFGEESAREWQENRFSAHAGGDIDGLKYTNSREAIETSISEGFSIINVDLTLTSDNQFVLVHDWSDNANAEKPLSWDELSGRLMYDVYHYCTLEDLLAVVKDGNVWVILDAKCSRDPESFYDFYTLLSSKIAEYDASLFERFIVEVYSANIYEIVSAMGFPYQYVYFPTTTDSREIYQNALFCMDNGINTMLLDASVEDELLATLTEKGFKLYIYNINTIFEAREKAAAGAWGFQTDYLNPKWSKFIFER